MAKPKLLLSKSVVSDLIVCRNSKGQKIIGYYDHCEPERKNRKDTCVVIPPGYGDVKADYIGLGYYLASNGFKVIRFDGTNHTGESEGDISQTSLSGMKDDLKSVIDYVEKTFAVHSFGVVAFSVGARISIKLSSEDKRILFLINLAPVVNLRSSLKVFYREDLVAEFEGDRLDKEIDIMGFSVSSNFLKDAIVSKFESMETTIEDVKRVKNPMAFFVAEKDVWVDADDVDKVYKTSANDNSRFTLIPKALHQLNENPKLAKKIILDIVNVCKAYNGCNEDEENQKCSELYEPHIKDIVRQNKVEKERLKKISIITTDTERDFWEQYLTKYTAILKSPDFQELMSSLIARFGVFDVNDVILDAGCGNGYFGLFLLKHFLQKGLKGQAIFEESTGAAPRYIGIDFVEEALKEAKSNHDLFLRDVANIEGNQILDLVHREYQLVNLEKSIPYEAQSVDKICCNLVISYLNDPAKVLRNLVDLLKEGGLIIVSSLKPSCDISLVYANYANMVTSKSDILEGRKLLSEAGQIRKKEKEGHYQFYSRQSLLSLMRKMKLIDIDTYCTFGNQANVVVARKGAV